MRVYYDRDADVNLIKGKKVAVLYGGRSGEHEVSLASAASIFTHLDAAKYEAIPVRIEKTGLEVARE